MGGPSLQLTAVPDPGQTFLGWSGTCQGVDPICEPRIGGSRESNWLVASFGPAHPVWARPIVQHTLTGWIHPPSSVLAIEDRIFIAGATGQVPFLEAFDTTGAGRGRLAFDDVGGDVLALAAIPGEAPLLVGGEFAPTLTLGELSITTPVDSLNRGGFVLTATRDLAATRLWGFIATEHASVRGVAWADDIVVAGDYVGALTEPVALVGDGGKDIFVAKHMPDDTWQAVSIGSEGDDRVLSLAVVGEQALLLLSLGATMSTPVGDLPAGQALLAIVDAEIVAAVTLSGNPVAEWLAGAGLVALEDGAVAVGIGYTDTAAIGEPHPRGKLTGLVARLQRQGATFVTTWVVHIDSEASDPAVDDLAMVRSLARRGDQLYAGGMFQGTVTVGAVRTASHERVGLVAGFDLADGTARWLRRVGGLSAPAVVGAGDELYVGTAGIEEGGLPYDLGPDVPFPESFDDSIGPYLVRFADEREP
jgi:hypothetical protein